jgi:hypothetical protein
MRIANAAYKQRRCDGLFSANKGYAEYLRRRKSALIIIFLQKKSIYPQIKDKYLF